MEQAPHWEWVGHVFSELAQHVGLSGSQFEIERSQEGLDQVVIASGGNRDGLALEILSAQLNSLLQVDEFVQGQAPLARALDLIKAFGEVNLPDSAGAGWKGCQAWGQLGPRLDEMRLVQRNGPPNEGAEPPLRESFCQWVDRDNPVKVEEGFFSILDDLGFGMVDCAGLDRDQFPGYHDFIALGEVFLHEWQIPPAAMKTRRSVIEDDLEERFRMFPKPLNPHGHDLAPREHRLASFQISNTAEMAPILIASRGVQQQIFDCCDLQAGQLRCPFRPNACEGHDRARQW